MDSHDELRSAPMSAGLPGVVPAPAADVARREDRHFEVLTGVLLAAWAAMLAACDIGGSNADNNCLLTANLAANAYSWYQSKSIKQDMTNSSAALLETLLATGHYDAATAAGLQQRLEEAKANVARYKKEKEEILKGSDQVGEANWVQENKDKKLGQITGADEYKAQSDAYNEIGNGFDIGSLLFQVGLAIGALSLLFSERQPRLLFFWGMNALGASGTCYCALGYLAAYRAGMFN